MEPKQHSPRTGHELPAAPQSPEAWSVPSTPERPGDTSAEYRRQTLNAPGESELPIPIVPVVQSASLPAASSGGGVIPGDDSNPLTAGDDEVMEKVWVDKAKKIINDTKGDPYRREYEVGKLQADYIEKRYGKKLGEDS